MIFPSVVSPILSPDQMNTKKVKWSLWLWESLLAPGESYTSLLVLLLTQ